MKCMILDELEQPSSYRSPSLPRLINCLSIPSSYQNLFERLIGNWVICHTEEEAISFQKKNSHWNCLTIDGIEYYSKGEVSKNGEVTCNYGYFAGNEKLKVSEDEIEEKKKELERVMREWKEVAEELHEQGESKQQKRRIEQENNRM